MVISACAMPQESPEAKAKRLERRKAHLENRRRAEITHLSGLSDMELEALKASKIEGSTSSKDSFIYGSGDIAPDKRNYLNDLNDYDSSLIKERNKDSKRQRRTSSDFVFGL